MHSLLSADDSRAPLSLNSPTTFRASLPPHGNVGDEEDYDPEFVTRLIADEKEMQRSMEREEWVRVLCVLGRGRDWEWEGRVREEVLERSIRRRVGKVGFGGGQRERCDDRGDKWGGMRTAKRKREEPRGILETRKRRKGEHENGRMQESGSVKKGSWR
jgi:hypothetical protein